MKTEDRDQIIFKLHEIVKNELSTSRFKHSLRVAEISESLSKQFHYPFGQKAYICGLLHDITKQKNSDFHILLFKKNKFDEYKDIPESSYHSFSARFYLQESHGFQDEEIFSAIDTHTLGSAKMNLLQKILYVADFLGSDFAKSHGEFHHWMKKTRKNLDYGLYLKSTRTIENLIQKKQDIHNKTIEVYRASILALKKEKP